MNKQIIISEENINVLRETFNAAIKILDSLEEELGSEKPPKKAPKETKAQKMKRYDDLIMGRTKTKKPDHLKK